MTPVPPHSIDKALEHVRNGGRLAIPTYTHCTIIDANTLAKWEAAGEWLLKEDGQGYRIRRGKNSDYIGQGGLVFA